MGEGAAVAHPASQETRPGAEREALHSLVDLYRDHERRIHRICFAHFANQADAEDATQETFIRAANYLDRLTGEPGAYLSKVAHTVCCDELRRRRVRDTALANAASEMVTDTEQLALPRAELEDLWRQLNQNERALLSLTYAGYSYEEVARRTGRSLSATAVAVMRARGHARSLAAASATVLLLPVAGWRLVTRLARRAAGSTAPNATGVAAFPAAFVVTASLSATLIFGAALPSSGNQRPGPAPPRLLAAAPTSGATGPASSATVAASRAGGSQSAAAEPSAQPAHPAQPVAPGSVAAQVINPGANATPADATFTSFTASPNYQQDGTVFASGGLVNGCLRPELCAVLFVSRDRGATWTNLHPSGFAGGRILVPPTFSLAPTIYANGALGLERSDDGGASFRVVVPGAAPAAIDATAAGGYTVVVASQPALLYMASTGTVVPGPALPPIVGAPTDVAVVGSDVIVSAPSLTPSSAGPGGDGVIIRCPGGKGCRVQAVVSGDPYLSLALSPALTAGPTLWAFSPSQLLVSHDGGISFVADPLHLQGAIASVSPSADFASSHALLVDTTTVASTGQMGSRLVRATETGSAQLGNAGMPAHSYVDTVNVLPDGRILTAPKGAAADELGITCSTDGGTSWRASC